LCVVAVVFNDVKINSCNKIT